MKRIMGQSRHKRSAYPLLKQKRELAAAEKAVVDAAMERFAANRLGAMCEATERLHVACAALAKLRVPR